MPKCIFGTTTRGNQSQKFTNPTLDAPYHIVIMAIFQLVDVIAMLIWQMFRCALCCTLKKNAILNLNLTLSYCCLQTKERCFFTFCWIFEGQTVNIYAEIKRYHLFCCNCIFLELIIKQCLVFCHQEYHYHRYSLNYCDIIISSNPCPTHEGSHLLYSL